MAEQSMRLELNRVAIGELALRSDGVRQIVGQKTAEMAQQMASAIGEENVSSHVAGVSRARGYVRRLDGASAEAVDGRLARILRGSSG